MTVDELTQAIAALVAVVSLAMIALTISVLQHCWRRFEQHRRKLSWPASKATGSLGLFVAVAPTSLLLLWVLASAERQDAASVIVSSVLIILALVLVVFLAVRYNGVSVRRRTKGQSIVQADLHTLLYFAALVMGC